jgi:hypothetical protein
MTCNANEFLLSLLIGWWGLPWGPVYTLEMININSDKQGGATDVTEDVLLKISDKDITIEYLKGWGTSNKNPRTAIDGFRLWIYH